jgi:hypothetical protein
VVAAILIARGVAPDVGAAVTLVRERRPAASPTRTDIAFLETMLPGLRELVQRDAGWRRSG